MSHVIKSRRIRDLFLIFWIEIRNFSTNSQSFFVDLRLSFCDEFQPREREKCCWSVRWHWSYPNAQEWGILVFLVCSFSGRNLTSKTLDPRGIIFDQECLVIFCLTRKFLRFSSYPWIDKDQSTWCWHVEWQRKLGIYSYFS